MNSIDSMPLMVTIRCITYNHEPYIRQCLEGFVMQKTNFRFEAIVHDDASTDGTADIIREYAERYPDIIKPIYEVENQYSKRDGSLRRIMDEHTHGKYVALCEGDDYWIDPLKLQKQVDFLEEHTECSMTCSRAKRFSNIKQKYIDDVICSKEDDFLEPKYVIGKGGAFIATCSILYRKEVIDSYPLYCRNCYVGDYPLQIMCAMKGKIWYYNETMAVYRVENTSSWTARTNNLSPNVLYKQYMTIIRMLEGFCLDYPIYSKIFMRQRNLLVMWLAPYKGNKTDYQFHNSFFKSEILSFNFNEKIVFHLMKSNSVIARVLRRNRWLRGHINSGKFLCF